jgi:hypothetical protein
MAPSAPAYVLCNAVAGMLFFAVYLNGPLILFPVGLGLVLLPLAAAAVAGLFRREAVAEVYYGFLISYRLSERNLVLLLGRTIPLYRVNLAEVIQVDRWRAVGPAAHGSGENNLVWFWLSRIWFWPRPVGWMLRNLFSIQVVRCEYVLVCETGWKIVLMCSREFIEQVARRVQEVRDRGEALPEPA